MYNLLIENFLTKEECQFLIDRGLSETLFEMKSSKILNNKVIEENVSNYNNKRRGTYFTNEILREEKITDLSNKIINIINSLKILKGVEYNGVTKYSFNEYSKGDFLNWHKDAHEIIYGATITLIIQLNDDYEGGDVMYRIDNVDYNVPKKQGSVFIFDSNIEHSVNELKNGIRYSLNVWPTSIKRNSMI